MNNYIRIPNVITWEDLSNKEFSLSSSQYVGFIMPNSNFKYVRDFLIRPLGRADLGNEVGSLSYIDKSPFYFIRAKALQDFSFLLDLNKETYIPVLPSEFVQMNLKKGDILISKDSNIGEIVILEDDYPNSMLSSAIYRLPVLDEWKYYLLGFIKHDLFREQLDSMVPKGATIRHAKTMFLDCKIPIPNVNKDQVVKYISMLTKAIIDKEILIKKRHNNILSLIEQEIQNNQSAISFNYKMPKLSDILNSSRLDTNMYSEYFKRTIFMIKNYKYGFQNIEQLGFRLSRGQNLQISNIGKSIYSDDYHNNFYTVVLPKFLSKYGTIKKTCFLGNPNNLKTLKKGDLIFGAEGFEKGRSIVVIEDQSRTITNIHGITLQQDIHDLPKAIFVKCFMDYLRSKGLIDLFAVGGNGGSLAQKYWSIIPFPNFPPEIRNKIVNCYYSSSIEANNLSFDDFIEKDTRFNEDAGVFELDKSEKKLKILLSNAINNVANNKEVEIVFS